MEPITQRMRLPSLVHSLQGKMLVYLAFPVILIIAVTVIHWYHNSLNQAISQAKLNLSQTADIIASKVNEENQLAVRTAEVMAIAQQSGMFGDRAASLNYARAVLRMNPSLVGVYFGYEPNADQQDLAYVNSAPLSEGGYVDQAGRFLPYWHRDFNDPQRLVLEPLVDMESSLYYAGLKQQYQQYGHDKAMITEPYVYEGRMLVEQTFPIVIEGEFAGIAGVDRALADIQTFLIAIKQQLQIDVFLLSQRDNVIATTLENSELETKAIVDTGYGELLSRLRSPEHSLDVLSATDPRDQAVYFFDTASINVGNWTVMVRRSQSDIIGPIQTQFRPLLGLAAVSSILILIIFWYFINRTTQGINIAINALEELANGNLSIHVEKYMVQKDELGTMFRSFNRLIQASKDIDRVCSAIAGGDFSRTVSKRSEHDSLSDSINLMSTKRHEAEQALMNQAEELLRTQQELVEAEKMSSLGSLVSGVAHEVNTPLGVCVTAASHLREMLQDINEKIASGSLSKTEFSEFISETDVSCEMLLKNMQRAADLISSFKRVAVDQTTEELRNLIISDYFNEVLKSLYHTLKTTSIEISIVASEPEPETYSDPGALAQIFTNLVMNSVIHGFEDGSQAGQIEVQIEYAEQVRIHYKDTGRGMSAEVQKKVFDPFYTTNRTRGGSGLGMNIVYNLVVHRLKGQISVKHKDSSGVYFFIQFPANLPD
ncbi:ATP-binding protein [Pseudoalteromonas mariniglutinosa]|uniref:sensor histidine kinase n=2 Tax=Pseudoalteromonas mariniglutinosa TaxID=206042 RepID=UPI003850CC92